MNRIRFGVAAGIVFGILDVLPMLAMRFPFTAMAGAFTSRFAIGFLIPQIRMSAPDWLTGLIVGLLISIPDAIITGAYGPILGTGVIGGAVIGFLVGWSSKKMGSSGVPARPAKA
jgi:prepilin signal peptidase PulO-like enzyme (type II secretory pathway)